jgi:nucleotide-binding universal stress UspA family protein
MEKLPKADSNRIQVRKVLVALDTSQPAVLNVAMSLCDLLAAELIVVHASLVNEKTEIRDPRSRRAMREDIELDKNEIVQLARSHPSYRALNLKVVVDYGVPLELVSRIADVENVDLIVAGTHGPGALERLALGSIAESIVRKARCPVLLVGPNCRGLRELKSIACASDLVRTKSRVSRYAIGLAKMTRGHIKFVHVIPSNFLSDQLLHKHYVADARRKLSILVSQALRSEIPAEVAILAGKPDETIIDFVSSRKTDVVIIGRNHHLFNSRTMSLLSKLVRRITCPILVVCKVHSLSIVRGRTVAEKQIQEVIS